MSLTRSLCALALCVAAATVPAHACSDTHWKACAGKPWIVGELETPLGERWWPHPLWGAGDEAGSTNWYARPEVVKRALAEARIGKTYRLGRTGVGESSAQTRFDGLGQLGVPTGGADANPTRLYNGLTRPGADASTTPKSNGLDKLHPIVARGILIDLAGAKGVPFLDAGTEITPSDVRDALARQGLAELRLLPGDAVLFRTGWGVHASSDSTRFSAGQPGIGFGVARWLSDDVQAGVVGSDTWGTEVAPPSDPACVRCVQRHLLVRHGIVMQHNLDLDALAADKVWRFLYVSPVPVAGPVGSPIAVR